MVTYYNLTDATNSSNMLELVKNTDLILGGGYFFGWFVLIIIGFVTFVTLKAKGYKTAGSFTVSLWFCMIISWMLRAMGLIDNYTLWACVILTVGSVFALFLSGN